MHPRRKIGKKLLCAGLTGGGMAFLAFVLIIVAAGGPMGGINGGGLKLSYLREIVLGLQIIAGISLGSFIIGSLLYILYGWPFR